MTGLGGTIITIVIIANGLMIAWICAHIFDAIVQELRRHLGVNGIWANERRDRDHGDIDAAETMSCASGKSGNLTAEAGDA